MPQVVAGFGVALPDRAGARGGTVEQGGRRTGRREPADGGQVAGPVPRVEAGRPAGRAEAGQTGCVCSIEVRPIGVVTKCWTP